CARGGRGELFRQARPARRRRHNGPLARAAWKITRLVGARSPFMGHVVASRSFSRLLRALPCPMCSEGSSTSFKLPSAFSKDRMRGSAGCALRLLAMKTLNRTILGGMPSALLLTGLVLCNFSAQADVVPYSKIGGWSVVYLEVGKLSGCRAAAQFPDQTIFQ